MLNWRDASKANTCSHTHTYAELLCGFCLACVMLGPLCFPWHFQRLVMTLECSPSIRRGCKNKKAASFNVICHFHFWSCEMIPSANHRRQLKFACSCSFCWKWSGNPNHGLFVCLWGQHTLNFVSNSKRLHIIISTVKLRHHRCSAVFFYEVVSSSSKICLLHYYRRSFISHKPEH